MQSKMSKLFILSAALTWTTMAPAKSVQKRVAIKADQASQSIESESRAAEANSSQSAQSTGQSTMDMDSENKDTALVTKNQYTVGLQTAEFKYSEPGLMKDTARLNGVRIGAEIPGVNHFLFSAGIEYLKGSGTYEGGLQSTDGSSTEVIPLTTDSKNSILSLRGLVGKQVELNESNILIPYAGIGYRFLFNSSSGPGSYDREITYQYIPLGSEWRAKVGSGFRAGLFAEYDLFLGGKVKSKLSQASSRLPDTENTQNPGSGYGYRVGATLAWAFNSVAISVRPFYHYWNIKDSVPEQITLTSSVIEPANNTKLTGLEVGVTF